VILEFQHATFKFTCHIWFPSPQWTLEWPHDR
jgi:hypothetical protein